MLFGWDASDFDWDRGAMDLGAAKRDGIEFFTHKATESTNVKHKHYGQALNRALSAGISFLGAYHVVRSSTSINSQVSYLLDYVNAATPWWDEFPGFFFQVDLEKWPYDAVPASKGEDFADVLEDRTGHRALIYASKGQYGDSLRGTSHPLWNAHYGSNLARGFKQLYADRGGDNGPGWASYSGVSPKIWQYGSNAIIGSQHTCDANAFKGTRDDFAKMIGATTVAIDEIFGLTSDPKDGRTTPTRVVDIWLGEQNFGETAKDTQYQGGYGTPTPRTKQLRRIEEKLDAVLKGQREGLDAEKFAAAMADLLPETVTKEMVLSAFQSPEIQAILKEQAFLGAQEAENK